jgi:hypothetical protein
MTDGVWALDLLPVVARERPAGKPGNLDTWSEEQLAALVRLREVEHKQWGMIALILQRPLKSCHRRYTAIVAAREPAKPKPLSSDAPRRRQRLHEDMGIRSYQIQKTIVDAAGRITVKTITLSGGLVPK